VHSPQVLCEQVLPVEVIVHRVIYAWGWRTHVASPEAKLDVFCADVPLPLILRGERRPAVVLRKDARKWPGIVR
jgi:hypothetical protein